VWSERPRVAVEVDEPALFVLDLGLGTEKEVVSVRNYRGSPCRGDLYSRNPGEQDRTYSSVVCEVLRGVGLDMMMLCTMGAGH
jgi:hypothetical protein